MKKITYLGLFLCFVSLLSCQRKRDLDFLENSGNEIEILIDQELLRSEQPAVIPGNNQNWAPWVVVAIEGSGKYKKSTGKPIPLNFYLTPGYKLTGWTVRKSLEEKKEVYPLDHFISKKDYGEGDLYLAANIMISNKQYKDQKRLYVSAVFEQYNVDYNLNLKFESIKLKGIVGAVHEVQNRYDNISIMERSCNKLFNDCKRHNIDFDHTENYFSYISYMKSAYEDFNENMNVKSFKTFYHKLNEVIDQHKKFDTKLEVLTSVLAPLKSSSSDIDGVTQYGNEDMVVQWGGKWKFTILLREYSKAFNNAFTEALSDLKKQVPNWEQLIQ